MMRSRGKQCLRQVLKKKRKGFFSDESALTTIEYVLILAIAVILTLLVIRTFIVPFSKKVADTLGNSIKNTFFKKGNMHRIRIP